jgi:hypothetical protein
MKIKLLRASTTIREIEFPATLPPLEIQRLAVDLMFENFDRNQTYLWPTCAVHVTESKYCPTR